jgi:hypothetical protein
MRELRGRALEGIGFVLGSLFVLVQLFLFFGGISYREECLTAGKIEKHWSFTWFAPLPYIFRPDPGSNCVVHTGTRVALNEIGIATFEPTTPDLIAGKSSERSGDPSAAYRAKLSASIRQYSERIDTTRSFEDGMENIEKLISDVEALEPPDRYADAHSDLLTAARSIRRGGESMREAAESGDKDAYESEQRRVEDAAADLEKAVAEMRRLEATQ